MNDPRHCILPLQHLYHTEYFMLNKKSWRETHSVTFTVPIFDPLPPQYILRAMSDRCVCGVKSGAGYPHTVRAASYSSSCHTAKCRWDDFA